MSCNYPLYMRRVILILISGLAFAACGTANELAAPLERNFEAQTKIVEPTQLPSDRDAPVASLDSVAPDPELVNRRVTDFDAIFPPQLIAPDGIRPIYEPRFVAAADAPLEDDELVIGISLEGESKAYPITVLRFREMVNDELGGLPILGTW